MSTKVVHRSGGAWSGLGLAAALAIPVAAHAQVGASGGEARTDVRVQLRATYDSNVAKSSAAAAAVRGVEQQDRIFQPGADFNIARPVGRQSVFLTGSAGYDFYDRNHRFNRERIDLTGGTVLQAQGCSANLAASYGRHQSQLQDLQALVLTRNVQTDQTYRASIGCPHPIGVSPTFSISRSQTENSLGLQKNADRRGWGGSAGLLYSHPNLGQLQVFAQYDEAEFPNRKLFTLEGERSDGYRSYSGVVRYERRLGRRLNTVLQASYTRLRPAVGSQGGFDGLTYQGDAALKLTSRMDLTLHGERGVAPVNRVGVSYARNQAAQIALKYRIGTRLQVESGGFLQDKRYVGASLAPGLFITHERVDGLFGSSELKVGRRLALLLETRWENRVSDLAAFNYKDLRVSVTTVAKF